MSLGGAVKAFVDPLGIITKPETKKAEEPAAAAPAPVAAPAAGPQNPDIQARSADFARREQQIGQRAVAAGVTRSDNEADLLGYQTPKRKSASRMILG